MDIIESVQEIDLTSGSYTWIYIIAAIAVVLLIIGLIKKALGFCLAAVVMCGFLGITSPEQIKEIGVGIAQTCEDFVAPFKDNDYSDLIGDDIFDTPNKGFDEAVKETTPTVSDDEK